MKHKIALTDAVILWLGHSPNNIDKLTAIVQALKSKGKPAQVADQTYKSYLELCILGYMRLDELADNLGIGVLSK